MSEWKSMYLQSSPDAREIALHKLARQYHERCDFFDDIVCTTKSERSGESIPANQQQASAINRNARHVLEQLTLEAEAMGLSKKDLIRAIQEQSNDNHRRID